MRSRGITLLAPLAFFVSCIPLPHKVQDLPRLEGTVYSSGEIPAADVRLHVSDITRANPCVRGEQVASTDPLGAFVTPGRRRLALFAPLLPVHSFDTWAVALIQSGTALGYVRPSNYRAGPQHSPRDVSLICDLQNRSCLLHDRSRRRQRTFAFIPCDQFSPDLSSETLSEK